MNNNTSNPWRICRLSLAGLAISLTLVGLFYTEENWRGKSAWESCKRHLAAQGIDFNWAHHIQPPVPKDQNVFGVPEMQKWFTGRGDTALSKKIRYPGRGMYVPTGSAPAEPNTPVPQLVVADLKIETTGKSSDGGTNVLRWGDPRAKEQAARLLKQALGPVVMHPGSSNLLFSARPLNGIEPAQIVLECQNVPDTNELRQFLPTVGAFTATTDKDLLELQAEEGGYKVVMAAPDSASRFLEWNAQFEPEFALIRNALQRPAVRMDANYAAPETVAIPNFVTARAFVQTMAAMTKCHLLEQNPEAALADLTQIHDLCRIFTNRPITLVGAMVNVAAGGLYADTIGEGLGLSSWREPQLAALEEQLKTMDVVTPVYESLRMEPVAECESAQSIPVERLFKLFFPDTFKRKWGARLLPRGWIYQNMVIMAQRASDVGTFINPVEQLIFPKQAGASETAVSSVLSKGPYCFLATLFIPNRIRACQLTALNQTKIHQALIACALERYHQARGEYPSNLSDLVPQFLDAIPGDVIGGEAPRYRRAADGSFVLYSIGWSGGDLGGTRGKSIGEGDWVWPEGY